MNKQESQKIENKVIEILRPYLQEKDTVIAGISGGPDSVFLLKILEKLPIKIVVAHLNHSLRGKESDLDTEFVANLAKNSHSFALKKIDIAKLSKNKGKGLEETGRMERYKFFNQLAKKHRAKYILTAHHADDNIETILFNFTRGSALRGLSGMPIQEKNLLRPLIFTTKQQILDYLNFHKIPFRTDKTNAKTIHSRNFIRHKIIPELKKLNPSLADTVAKNSQILHEDLQFIEQESGKAFQKCLTTSSPTHLELNSKTFRTLNITLQKNILRLAHETLTSSLQNLESVHLDEALHLIEQNIGNKSKKFGRCIITVKNNIIGLKKLVKK